MNSENNFIPPGKVWLTHTFNSWSLRLTQLEAEITQGGILRFSPLYLDGVIKDLSLELNEINLNTMVRRFLHSRNKLTLAQTTTNAALAVLEKSEYTYTGIY